MRLIDADILKINRFVTNRYGETIGEKRFVTFNEIDKMPTIDPVKHAKWINDDYDFICSLCRYESPDDSFYCPHCGAKMDRED